MAKPGVRSETKNVETGQCVTLFRVGCTRVLNTKLSCVFTERTIHPPSSNGLAEL